MLIGTRFNDRLQGVTGNDLLVGNAGSDVMAGGKGKDILRGGSGRDLLLGDDSNDTLLGSAGDDILVGGKGNDTLSGGGGKDMFVFNALNEGKDVIKDFTVGQDLVDLRSIFKRPEFSGTSAFDQYQKYVQLVQVGSSTEVRIDADGSGQGTQFATLASLQNTALSAVSARNFVIA